MVKSRRRAPSSLKAVSHGITSVAPVIPGMEREEDWLAHRDGTIESLSPEGHLERVLAGRVAELLWRLNRVTRFETAVAAYQVGRAVHDRILADVYAFGIDAIDDQAEGKRDDLPEPTPEEMALAREMRIIPGQDQLDKIMRYEAHLHRQWLQTLHELEALQARRLGQPTSPASISAPPPPSSAASRPLLCPKDDGFPPPRLHSPRRLLRRAALPGAAAVGRAGRRARRGRGRRSRVARGGTAGLSRYAARRQAAPVVLCAQH